MASVRVKGISAKVDSEKTSEIANRIGEELGSGYRVFIENDRVCVEGNMQNPDVRKKIKSILTS